MEAARKLGLNKEAMQAMLKEQKQLGTLNAAVTQQDFLTSLSKVSFIVLKFVLL